MHLSGVSGWTQKPLQKKAPVFAGYAPRAWQLEPSVVTPWVLKFGRKKREGVTNSPTRVILPQWQFNPGKYNAITDVPGVKVGHVSIIKDKPHTLRTGVTAIIPHSDNLAKLGLWGDAVVLNGNGEVTGLAFLQDTGVLNSPILLTNTTAVGSVSKGVLDYFNQYYPDQWSSGQLPVVGECCDWFFSNINDTNAVKPRHASEAILAATNGPVDQGRVGAGTGMRSFQLHAGIGSASRKIKLGGKTYTIGVLVNTNHSNNPLIDKMDPLVQAGIEKKLGSLSVLQQSAHQDQAKAPKPQQSKAPRQGSIVTIIATDMPLMPKHLNQIARRTAIGLGKMGSVMATTSGDFAIAFSTAHKIPLGDGAPEVLKPMRITHPDALTPVYAATIEAVTEAQMNALMASYDHLVSKPENQK